MKDGVEEEVEEEVDMTGIPLIQICLQTVQYKLTRMLQIVNLWRMTLLHQMFSIMLQEKEKTRKVILTKGNRLLP